MKSFGVLCGSLLISILVSCNKSNNSEKDITFLLSTSGCYRECSVLDLKLQNNIIYFNFLEDTKNKGTYKYELKSEDINTLNKKISNLDLKALKSKYSSDTPDVQMFNTSFVFMNKKRDVLFLDKEAPKSFMNLVDYLISLSNKKITKLDTTIDVTTRKLIPYEKAEIPPMPRNIDSIIDRINN
tara:strand:- start:1431 stop:1982 length:552 start_codon:yes stop_codon:yes gene_type:complete